MRTVKKLNFEEFKNKYSSKKHISCGITYEDDSKETVMNANFPYVEYVIKSSKKDVKYIAIC